MSDNAKTLIRMANQIADFYTPYSHDEAVAGVHDHIQSFWSPSMRRDLEHMVGHGGEGLQRCVIEAVRTGPVVRSPNYKGNEDANALGELASDAG